MKITVKEAKPDVVIELTAAEATQLVRQLESYAYWSDVRHLLKDRGYGN